ncbi:MAG: hypothetical protein M0Q88_02830 [Bacilli bacterium]|nr:hypothetical protein [Bacilli bacterium]
MDLKTMVDLTVFIAFSLSTNPIIKKDLDKLYEEYKYKAYNAAKKSKYYTSSLLTDGSIEREVASRRALGLIELNKDKQYENLSQSILDMFIKGWKGLYLYVEKCEFIDIDYIFKNILVNQPDDDYYVGFNTALLLFSSIFEKDIMPIEFRNDMIGFLYSYIEHVEKGNKRFSFDSIKNDKELFEKAKNIKNRFYEYFKQLTNTCDLVDIVIDDEELAKYCRAINMIFDVDKMMLSSMSDNAKINERDVIELAGLYFIHYKNQNRLESAKFILFGLHLKYAIKSYKGLKEFYFKNNKETAFIELERHEEHINILKKENSSLNRQIEVLKHNNDMLRKEYKENIEKENILLKQEIQKLKNTIHGLEKEKIELEKLTNSFFEIDSEDLETLENNIVIPKIKGIIAGGYPSWHDKLKDVLPDNFIYIEGDNEKFDVNVLSNKDYVFIYTKYMSHGFYYKLIERCRKLDTNIYYISSTSPNYVKKEIYDFLQTKGLLK